jgi:ABC-type uncharacterized transport system permease subunit
MEGIILYFSIGFLIAFTVECLSYDATQNMGTRWSVIALITIAWGILYPIIVLDDAMRYIHKKINIKK